jgi:hypothetical protein
LIEQIGSYAGLAAIPGLAVLSALYFSQARDVRRLRDWAGRAPERAAEQAMGGRVVAQPQQAAQPAATAAQPGAAAAGATVAKPAVAAAAGAQAATAAGPAATEEGKAEGEAATDGDAQPAVAKPGALTPAAVASAAAGAAKAPARAGAAAASGSGGSATGTVTRPGPPAVGAGRPPASGAVPPRRQIPRLPSSQTSVLGTAAAPRERWYRRLAGRLPAGRYIALILAGALVLGGGAAFGITQLTSTDSGGGGSSNAPKSTPPAASKNKSPTKKNSGRSTPAIDPSKFTVTVVNGTTIPNLARDTAAKLSQVGFQIGNKVTGTGSLAAAESVVEYKPGAEAAARYVAAKLHITQKQPADPDAVAQAGPAQVIVVLGADQAPGG